MSPEGSPDRPAAADNGKPALSVALAWLFLAVAIVHHPVLWIDHILWDEISFEKMAATGDLSGKLTSLADQGVGSAYPFYALFSRLPESTRMLRLCSFLSIWIMAATCYRILRLRAGVPARQAFGAALVMTTYPAFQMYANAGTAIYVIHMAIFALAAECYLAAVIGVVRKEWWFIPSAGLWIVSFTFQPLLVYFYAFFATLALSRPLREWQQHWQSFPRRASFLRIHVLLWTMPFVHYFLQKVLFPLHPYFASWYSRPRLELAANLRDGLTALDSSLLTPLRGLMNQGPASWLFILATGLLLVLVFRTLFPQVTTRETEVTPVTATRLVLAGLVLLAAGLLPFIVTGKPPSANGPETRYGILVAPSLAILASGCLAGLARLTSRAVRSVLGFIGCSLLAGFTLLHARVYIDWQAAAIKDHTIIATLSPLSPPPGVNFFVVTGHELEHRYVRRHYDWGYILHAAWSGYDRSAEMQSRLGPTDRHYYTPIGMSREKLANFREWMGYGSPGPPDRWCRLELHPTASFAFGSNPWRVVATDLWYRSLGSSGEREAWLRKFISHATISPPLPYAFGSETLPRQSLQWEQLPGWMSATSRIPVRIEPADMELHVHESVKGRFSIIPLGLHGFAIRCDSLPETGESAVINIEMRPSMVSAFHTEGNKYGIACDVYAFREASPPRIFMVTPNQEIEGTVPRPGLTILEAWGTAPPLRFWFIWTAHNAGELVQVKHLRYGTIAPPN